MPTVLLSNHPGHPNSAGAVIATGDMSRMVDALEANGWIGAVDAVLTGYLPSAAHVELAASVCERVRRARPGALVLCDPILGDDPKGVYIAAEAAHRIRDRLLPVADLATPNRLELSFLSGREVRGVDEAARALECLACGGGLATSIPAGAGELANVLSLGPVLAVTCVARRAHAAHGTGDLMAGALLGHLLAGAGPASALGAATATVDAVLACSGESDELQLTAALPLVENTAPWTVRCLAGRQGPKVS